jgi:hypothetical protein
MMRIKIIKTLEYFKPSGNEAKSLHRPMKEITMKKKKRAQKANKQKPNICWLKTNMK